MITQKRLKELLHYDPDTGIFTWEVNKKRARRGDKAGTDRAGYIQIKIDQIAYKAHRLAWLYMEGYFPENEIDHINRVTDDNRWGNLREVSHQCNMRNKKIRDDNTSGVTGVFWNKKYTKWEVFIKVDGKQKYFGRHKEFTNAAQARWEAEVEYNFPNCNTTSSAYLWLKENHYANPKL